MRKKTIPMQIQPAQSHGKILDKHRFFDFYQ